MKTKLLLGLVFLATLGMTSCKKEKENTQPEPTTVKIGNKDYAIVKVGTQTWTAENYSGEGGMYFNDNNSKPYHGKLYTISEARTIQVPQGWRLPTTEDARKLVSAHPYLQKLMAKTEWQQNFGTNESGFNAFPVGYSDNESNFMDQGYSTRFWTASTYTEDNVTKPFYFPLGYYEVADGKYQASAVHTTIENTNNNLRFSVRFIKDN